MEEIGGGRRDLIQTVESVEGGADEGADEEAVDGGVGGGAIEDVI